MIQSSSLPTYGSWTLSPEDSSGSSHLWCQLIDVCHRRHHLFSQRRSSRQPYSSCTSHRRTSQTLELGIHLIMMRMPSAQSQSQTQIPICVRTIIRILTVMHDTLVSRAGERTLFIFHVPSLVSSSYRKDSPSPRFRGGKYLIAIAWITMDQIQI